MSRYILSIDQGTTSSRAILFDRQGQLVHSANKEFPQVFPKSGWVEHDPEAIWESTLAVCHEVMSKVEVTEVAGIGITNQRETTVLWDKRTGKAFYNAIVWQDRRTSDYCNELKKTGHESYIQETTGLLLDPYFSATKLRWIIQNVPEAKAAVESGDALFGTIDSFLLWRLTNGKSHKTDATNASRTLLFNIHSQTWDKKLLSLFGIPESILPTVEDSSADFGKTSPDIFGAALPIGGIAGDQQAALIGQACFDVGTVKSTYGTGCFLMVNTGDQPLKSSNRLLTTVGYRIAGKTTYALEGSIFVAGAVMQWLRDGLGVIKHASESEAFAEKIGAESGVYLVPAFTGLGAPYWDPEARGAIFGLTRDSSNEHFVTAGLQSVGYQTRDLLEAMKKDGLEALKNLRVDGGMAQNNWVMQFLADILDVTVDLPKTFETTALGACYLAGLQIGWYESLDDIADNWSLSEQFSPNMPQAKALTLYQGWNRAVSATQAFSNLN